MSSSDTDETPTISFLISNKKKRLLVIDGYIYQQNKSTAKVSYWLCEIKLCNAGVHLNSDDQFRKYTGNPHTHMPVPERLEIRKMLTNIKSRVDREAKAIGQIYHEELLKANLFSKLLLSIINSFEIFDFFISIQSTANSTSNETSQHKIEFIQQTIKSNENNCKYIFFHVAFYFFVTFFF
ncbi:unnamed protein product [Rotaria magnacalcarata]|uniref:FLYWCH-type domain-containing protein n=1 Tax=Rotaria magnacalcarata TaxID=392030 RepID=A0A816RJB5_9BILA|nr:unnamed protein product [Rotaria magnacalcarata]